MQSQLNINFSSQYGPVVRLRARVENFSRELRALTLKLLGKYRAGHLLSRDRSRQHKPRTFKVLKGSPCLNPAEAQTSALKLAQRPDGQWLFRAFALRHFRV
jgi:hypothetical protein